MTPADAQRTMERLERGGAILAELSVERLLEVWEAAIAELRDPDSATRRRLIEHGTTLSPEGLAAALDTVLDGVTGEGARRLAETAPRRIDAARRPMVVVLASNIPGLAVQAVLPALLARRPLLLKSSVDEPLFAALLVDALHRREPRLRDAVLAAVWPGGAREIEDVIFARAERVVAYGGGATIDDLRARLGERLVDFGPKLSLAVVSADALRGGLELTAVARGLARDIALFDQRGCLSVQAIYVEQGMAEELARALAEALDAAARELPPGDASAEALAGVQSLRGEALLRGLTCHELAPRAGTVVVEPSPELRPSPGLRTVRIHPVATLDALPALLEPWRGRLQGAALAGTAAWGLAAELAALGVSRCAAPGDLQRPDATWENGGLPPLDVFR